VKLSVIVPAYDEAGTIADVVRRVRAQEKDGLSIEVIVVDDGSADGTSLAVAAIVPPVTLLRHPGNRGKGAAIRTALDRATGDAVIVQDADLEYDPADLSRIASRLGAGERVVYGSRIMGNNPHSYLRYYWGGRLLTGAFNLLYGTRLTDVTTCYKGFAKDAILAADLRSSRFEFCIEVTALMARRGERIVEIPIAYNPRSMSQGKKIRWHDGVRALWMMIRLRVGAGGPSRGAVVG
jgi:glycosyltransferase involved in cell wall biosynthesis